MLLKVTHNTTYHYSLPAYSSANELRLTPEHSPHQSPRPLELSISPSSEIKTTRDFNGNLLHNFTIEEAHDTLEISALSEVETHPYRHQPERTLQHPLGDSSHLKALKQNEDLYPFLSDSSCIPPDTNTWREAIDIQSNLRKPQLTFGHLAQAISQHLFDHCEYRDQHLHYLRTSAEVQKEKFGTCQDFAHLMIAYLRALGIPARYRSGYLYDPGLDPTNTSHHPELIGTGVTHAWVDFYTPEIGWVGIDPTNNGWTDERYISLAQGRDYHDVVPIQGSFLGGGSDRQLDVQLTIEQIED